MIFCLIGLSGTDIAFAYYVWVGVFSVMILAQFWAHAADTFNPASGQRLFPVIMAGATLGGLAGPLLVRVLFPLLGPWWLMFIAGLLLAATLPLVGWTRECVPETSRNTQNDEDTDKGCFLGGFSLVLKERYLLLLALLVVLLNCVNTTGEYMLSEFVLRYADSQVATHPGADAGVIIASFYGDFFLAINSLTVLLQVFVVSRVFRWIGIRGAILVLPVIAIIGYGLVIFLPVFGMIRMVKILEDSTDYSVMNTARHLLYLPLPANEKYEGKIAIDTFFWRFGDVIQAGVIYVGLNWAGFEITHFAMLNMFLAMVWIGVAMHFVKVYAGGKKSTTERLAPESVPVAGDA